MELSGKRIAILIEDVYNEFEFWYPYYRMKEAGAQVTVVGTGRRNTTARSACRLPEARTLRRSRPPILMRSSSPAVMPPTGCVATRHC